jgi:hypothetical protein
MPEISLSYFQNIPLGTNTPAQDQPNMLSNNNNVFTAFNVDHVNFKQAGTGLHAQVNLPNGVGNTTPKTPVGNPEGCVIYGQTFGFASTSQFTVPTATLKVIGGAGTITGAIIGPALRSSDFTTLWPGILVQYGQVTTGIGTGQVTFQRAYTNGASVRCIQATPIAGGGEGTAMVWVKIVDGTKFDWKLAGTGISTTGFYWMAIGF